MKEVKPLDCIERILNPSFDTSILEPEKILFHVQELIKTTEPVHHSEILSALIDQLEPLDFEIIAFPQVQQIRDQIKNKNLTAQEIRVLEMKLARCKVTKQHYQIISIENIRDVAEKNHWGLCKNTSFVYIYNGNYWQVLNQETFQMFLGEASEKMSVGKFIARYYKFRKELYEQFLSTEYLPTPEPQNDIVLINLKNGTFEVTPSGTRLRPFDQADFLTYQLPFEFDREAKAPIFQAYLDRVLPDKQQQMILAEYLGYVFIKHGSSTVKLEKVLVLYGLGANGKSVFHEIVNALLGKENVSSYTIQSLTNESGYQRAMIANKLVNYVSEISGNLQASIFKQLASGEPVEARLPYEQPFTMTQYAKLIFNCNELPKEVEHTNAYFRRFLIVPFDVTIPEAEQDKLLHRKIIDNELSGVFNWVLEGLNRLLINKSFTQSEAVRSASEQYEIMSDSVRLFIEDNSYQVSSHSYELIKTIYQEYRSFCYEDGFKPVNKTNFIRRLKGLKVPIEKRNIGNVAFLMKYTARL
jgi:putative DNA primase/helicase